METIYLCTGSCGYLFHGIPSSLVAPSILLHVKTIFAKGDTISSGLISHFGVFKFKWNNAFLPLYIVFLSQQTGRIFRNSQCAFKVKLKFSFLQTCTCQG